MVGTPAASRGWGCVMEGAIGESLRERNLCERER